MRQAPNERVEKRRLPGIIGGPSGTNCGAFSVEYRGAMLRVIASNGGGWDHVSVSASGRCPTWPEMDHVKDLFFYGDEVVMQLHVAKRDHINFHPYCLHLWRPQTAEEIETIRRDWVASGEGWPFGDLEPANGIPMPPAWMVGPKVLEPAKI